MRQFMFSLATIALGLTLSGSASAEHRCCLKKPRCQPACDTVCTPAITRKPVACVSYECQCETVCLPKCNLPKCCLAGGCLAGWCPPLCSCLGLDGCCCLSGLAKASCEPNCGHAACQEAGGCCHGCKPPISRKFLIKKVKIVEKDVKVCIPEQARPCPPVVVPAPVVVPE